MQILLGGKTCHIMELGQAVSCCFPYTKEKRNKLAEEKSQISCKAAGALHELRE